MRCSATQLAPGCFPPSSHSTAYWLFQGHAWAASSQDKASQEAPRIWRWPSPFCMPWEGQCIRDA